MIQTSTEATKDFGDVWIDNPNFGVSIAALFIICVIFLVGYLIRNVVENIGKKIERLIRSNTKEHDKVIEKVDKLEDSLGPIRTWINIDIKRKLNGDYDDEN